MRLIQFVPPMPISYVHFLWTTVALTLLGLCSGRSAAQGVQPNMFAVDDGVTQLLENYCLDCHVGEEAEAGVDLEAVDPTITPANVDIWERVLRKLSFRQMPPAVEAKPKEDIYGRTTETLARSLDQFAAAHPRPGRTATFRRLTRVEYANAIRDLLALKVDSAKWLPKDESSYGFDNITVQELNPTLLTRYLQAAEEISRRALGRVREGELAEIFRVPGDVTQERHMPGLPIGTRGGTVFPYDFPQTAAYDFQIKLTRDRNEHVEGLVGRHELHLLVDDRVASKFEVKPPPKGSADHSQVDAHLRARVHIEAGRHQIGVTFVEQGASLIETMRQPYQARFNMHRHPRTAPAILEVSFTGPYDATGPGHTPSRTAILGTDPASGANPAAAAKALLHRFAERAWRGPVSDAELSTVMKLFHTGFADGGFEAGMEMGVAGILVSPRFLFRIERDPVGMAIGDVYSISDVEFASRLSFFLWSSIPDLAERQNAWRRRASLLDAVMEDLHQLARQMGPQDRARVNEYLESVRDVERRIQIAEKSAKDHPVPDIDRPQGVPADYAEHARLMFELQRLAFQGDITRIITFQLARETSNRTYPQIGVSEPHHPLTHHGNDPAKIEKMAKINQFHVSLFAEHLQKLVATPEGNGSLLDHALILYGSGMGNPNVHDHQNLPIIVAGGAAGRMQGNRHVKFSESTPLANVHLTLLNKVGVRLDKFADSTGRVEQLFASI